MTKGSIHGRLEKLEAKAPAPAASSGVREKMLEVLDRIAAWRRAGSPDTEEGRELQALAEALKRRRLQMQEGGR
jgi:hypothetical protein